MEIRDGFIVGISNYCDRWCERCAFTSDCRLFADSAEAEAHHDPHMAAIVHAPVRAEDEPPPPPRWLEELIERANEDAENMTDDEIDALVEPPMPGDHAVTCARAMDYCVDVHDWSRSQGDRISTSTEGPMEVITWFAGMIMSKTARAFHGLATFDGDRTYPADHEGSAKIALLGAGESITAWQTLAASGQVDQATARRFVRELEILRTDLESAIPLARVFVRPGLDELPRAER